MLGDANKIAYLEKRCEKLEQLAIELMNMDIEEFAHLDVDTIVEAHDIKTITTNKGCR